MTEQPSSFVTLPKIGILWTPREQKILFGGIIILEKGSAVLRETDKSETASVGLGAPEKCTKETLSHAYLLSRPERPVGQGSQVAVGGFLPEQRLQFCPS